ncbi:MAG TPA: hypothetical protein VKX25_15740 [Bryobacteraceae bacterium]|jgi:glutamate-ammonia-ligase adenylyltransferase|nr:hypothetical protein [Bryobacteraceae bacterium]
MPLTRPDESASLRSEAGPDPVSEIIARSSDPERTRRYFHELQIRHPQFFAKLASDQLAAHHLGLVFSASRFLADELLRYPEWIFELDDLTHPSSREDYHSRLSVFLSEIPGRQIGAEQFALFRRKEILRILLRDLLQVGTLREITEELSNLADAILGTALLHVFCELEPRFGQAKEEHSQERARFCVMALGKLGGRELNYSSDIDLMFLYSENGETSGPERITNKEFFKRAANHFTNLLSSYTPAGQCYRLDLRLRPEGTHGEICLSLRAASEYYARRARDWELQMLLKARVAAGDRELGVRLLGSVEPLIYSTTLDFSTIETMSETRERISEKIARKTRKPGAIDVKLTRGGIRDIEFLVQCLQRLHGSREHSVKDQSTLGALARLHRNDLLSTTEFSRLAHAYQFLRRLEHILQFENDRQTHTLPTDAAELERIGLLLGADGRLLPELNQHLENVQGIYERIVHAQRPLYYTAQATPSSSSEPEMQTAEEFRNGVSELISRLNEGSTELRQLAERPAVAEWSGQLFELSPPLAGELIRQPELLHQIERSVEHPARRYAFEGLAAPLNDIAGLRRFFRREMFRIQTASICVPEPVFQTLDQTSALAEFVIARAYRIALEQGLAHAREHATDAKPFREPETEMMVVALGRLGMREFDIGSDADLLFIIPETEAPRQRFWTRVTERLLDILSGYGEGGAVLSIDTRLRPNGREGNLVQTESAYADYFSNKAEAWEGIAYMKARAVAGDTERATKFLSDLQQVDWRRYGQGGRSKLALRQMRLRLEKEQGAHAPLKAAQGSYYDADFILMYLRLRGAGMFFKSLNTPERIDILEKMGHLDRADAEFLLEATTHFRALDHALRLVTGHSEGRIPPSAEQRAMIAKLMNRWTGQRATADNLETNLADVQTKMRRLFDTVFAA